MTTASRKEQAIERVFYTTYQHRNACVAIGWQPAKQSYYLRVDVANHPRQPRVFDSRDHPQTYPSIEPLLDILERQLKLRAPSRLLCEIIRAMQATKSPHSIPA